MQLTDLYDHHASTLWSMALFLFTDLDDAESVVADLLLEAADAPTTMSEAGTRRDLSRRMYLTARRLSTTPGSTVHRTVVSDDDSLDDTHVLLASLSEKQRCAIALCWFGDHTYQEVASLMSLSETAVLGFLESGLQVLGKLSDPLSALTRSTRPHAGVEGSATALLAGALLDVDG